MPIVLDGSLGITSTEVETDYGTAGAPTHSFSLDNDTGMFRSGTNQLAFSVAGTSRLRINSTAPYIEYFDGSTWQEVGSGGGGGFDTDGNGLTSSGTTVSLGTPSTVTGSTTNSTTTTSHTHAFSAGLGDLSNVSLNLVSNGQILKFNSTGFVWENATPSISDFSDAVTTDTTQTISGTKTFSASTLTYSGDNLILSGSAASIRSNVTNSYIRFDGGNTGTNGATIILRGSSGSPASTGALRTSTTDRLSWNTSGVTAPVLTVSTTLIIPVV